MNLSEEEFASLLQACLGALESGEASLETLLARYPDQEFLLRPELEAAAWVFDRRQELEPREGFVSTSRSRLVASLRQEAAPTTARAQREHLKEFLDWLFRPAPPAVRLATIFSLIMILLFAFSGIAQAAQASLPGDTLYPVKRGLEHVAVVLNPDELGDTQLYIEYAQRRLLEIQSLALEGRYENIPETVDNLETEIQRALESVETVQTQDTDRARELATSLQSTLSEQRPVMIVLTNMAPPDTRMQMNRALQISQTGVNAAQVVIAQPANEPGVFPPSATNTSMVLPTEWKKTPPAVGRPTEDVFSAATAALFPSSTPTATDFPWISTDTPTQTERPPNTHKPPTKTPNPTETDPTETPTETALPTATEVPPTETPTLTPTPTETPTPEYPSGDPEPIITITSTPTDPAPSATPPGLVKPTKTPKPPKPPKPPRGP